MKTKKVALITGASAGIGEATALLFRENGYTVYGAARRIEKMKNLAEQGVNVIALDVTDEASVKHCVDTILEKEGRIDILVNNAGYGSYGALEDVPIDEGRRQFEVNIFGLALITQLVLPSMRRHQFGKIVNVSSIGGKIYSPFGGWYHATKHALEGYTDCLRLETKEFGIDAILVEPGGIKTEWGEISAENLKKTSGKGAYAGAANKTAETMTKMYSGNRLSDPSVVARTIFKAVTSSRPKTRYHTGYMSGLALRMRKLLSDRMFDRIIVSMS